EKWRRYQTMRSRNNSRRAVVGGIAEQSIIIPKVARAKSLQGMFDDKLVDFCLKIFRNIVKQFTHQHTGRQRLVVPGRLPEVAEIENLARGEECLQKKRAVTIADVAISTLRVLRDQIKTRRTIMARIVGVVHPEQANDLTWDTAHWLKRAKGHRPGNYNDAAACLFESIFQLRDHT